MNIVIQAIQHDRQRYDTCGDWVIHPDCIVINVSDTGNDDFNFLVAIHELVEVWLCQKRGIKQDDVDQFDMAYELNRIQGDTSEPGDSPKAPYRNEHCLATGIERIMCAALGIAWADYEEAIEKL